MVEEHDEDQDSLFMAGRHRFAAQMESIDSWKLSVSNFILHDINVHSAENESM